MKLCPRMSHVLIPSWSQPRASGCGWRCAKETRPQRVAEIDAVLTDYRAGRAAEKKAAAEAARAKLAAAEFWENWKGECQIGASQSSGNTDSVGLRLGIALNRKGID